MIIIFATIHKKTNDILKNIIFGSLSLDKQINKKKKLNQNKSKTEFSPKKLKKNQNKKVSKSKLKNQNNNILNSNTKKFNELINNPNKKLKKNNIINKKIKKKILNKKSKENSKQILFTKNFINTVNEKTVFKNSPRKNKKKLNNSKFNSIFIVSNKINNYENYLIINNNKHIENEKIKFTDKIIDLVSEKKRYNYFIDDELNSLNYEYALKIDTRSYCQVYYSLLKQNHLIIYILCQK